MKKFFIILFCIFLNSQIIGAEKSESKKAVEWNVSVRDKKIKELAASILTKESLKEAFSLCVGEYVKRVKTICENDEAKIAYLISKISSFDDELEQGIPLLIQHAFSDMSKNLAHMKDEQLLKLKLNSDQIKEICIEFIWTTLNVHLEQIKLGKDPFRTTTTKEEVTSYRDPATGQITRQVTKITTTIIEFGKESVVSVTES